MCTHCFASSLQVMTNNSVENTLVAVLSASCSSPYKDAFALLSQKVNDGVYEYGNERILRSLGQSQVKIQIGFDKGVGVIHGIVHGRHRVSHCSNMFFRRSLRSQISNLEFQYFANFNEIRAISCLPDPYH